MHDTAINPASLGLKSWGHAQIDLKALAIGNRFTSPDREATIEARQMDLIEETNNNVAANKWTAQPRVGHPIYDWKMSKERK